MARPRYPSDDARRKQRPHVKVHLSWPTHPRYGRVYADARRRGIVLGIWMVAARAHAGKTADQVTMSMSQIMEATGCDNPPTALRLLRDTAATMAWPMSETRGRGGVMVTIEIRNFARKQGYPPPTPAETPRTPNPSEFRRTEEQILRSADAERGGGTRVPPEKKKPRARPVRGSSELPQMPSSSRSGDAELTKLGPELARLVTER